MSMRCLIVGGQSLAVQCSSLLLEKGHQITGVVTSDPGLREWAGEHSIEVASSSTDLVEYARSRQFDCLFSIVNGRILPDEMIRQATVCAVNFHDGPLPECAGFNVTTWALLGGEPTHGITWHGMEGGIDAGAIFSKVVFDIAPNETAFTLNAKCWDAALDSFGPLVDGIASGTLVPEAQDANKRVYHGRYNRPKGLCVLDFAASAEELTRLSRAVDFGPYANPIGKLKLWDGEQLVMVNSLEPLEESSGQAPGTVTSAGNDSIRVATATSDVVLRGLKQMDGSAWRPSANVLPALDSAAAERITELHGTASRHEPFWVRRLSRTVPLPIERDFASLSGGSFRFEPLPVEGAGGAATVIAAFLAQLGHSAALPSADAGYQDLGVTGRYAAADPGGAFSATVPLRYDCDFNAPFEQFRSRVAASMEDLSKRETFTLDVPYRYPELKSKPAPRFPAGVRVGGTESAIPLPGAVLNLVVSPDGQSAWLATHTEAISPVEAAVRKNRLMAAVRAVGANPAMPSAAIPSMDESERARLLDELNSTATAFEDLPVHGFFEKQASARPDATALAFLDQSISYRELDARATRLAARLQSLGTGPGSVAGVFMNRSIDMVAALLAVLKTGAAYLPLDPTLPRERRQFMLEDARACAVLTEPALEAEVEAAGGVHVVSIDEAGESKSTFVPPSISTSSPAYVIYTSGSTGQPKGVVITHRNVANFFAGMDREIGLGSDPGVWLAVTSISFDISVLELFWTLARGFKVVLAADDHRAMVELASSGSGAKPADFSLFYFATDSANNSSDKYRLLLEGARYADSHGFHAVWTPERHFHSFGGLYPNPSVTAAAIAAVTSRVQIRAGSVVSPLHNPIRIAEEWSVVDNISGGRAGISFAAGWHSRDFVLAPGNYAGAKNIMFRNIDQVCRLWKGESLEFIDGVGNQVPVSILPRPIQKELPVWVTAAGNPETFRMAGEGGYNILTHLLGQKFEDVAKKIKVYRDARKSKGLDPNGGRVTLMLHTFVGETAEQAREGAREPMKNYLKTSVDLIKNSPWSFPAFSNKPGMDDLKTADLSTLEEEEMDALLEFAFERYFETSGLFGTVDQCVEIAKRVAALGVDEIGCLIDFGVETELALRNLSLLNEVRERCHAEAGADFSLPAQMNRHGVTHLQCTPSMAKMLVASEDSRAALGKLKKLMVGGEALPGALAADLARLVPDGTHNMYGPTETTIWSTTSRVTSGDVTIGRPVANTTIYVLNSAMEPVPTGFTGDLYIGGEGVAQGYWQRPELNAERFLANPFRPGERIYKTGDLARYRWDGSIEFLGRSDFQVKIRGFRIELGEIEALMNRYPGIRDSVVVASSVEGSEPVLAGYYVRDTASPAAPDPAGLRDWLKRHLPDYMAPSLYVEMEQFPLTHNGKIDRKALPAPHSAGAGAPEVDEESRPAGDLESLIAGIWQQALNRTSIGVEDNFFDLGGHSILVIQVNAKLGKALNQKIPIVDMFRYPTIRSLAQRLSGEADAAGADSGGARAKLRLEMQANRGQLRRGARKSA